MKILKEVYDYWQAEGMHAPDSLGPKIQTLPPVVFITSNYVGNREIQHGCKALGIPAFGTLWDFVCPVDHIFLQSLTIPILS